MELLAVHLPDGFLSYSWLAGGWLVATALIAVGVTRVSDEELPRIGVFTAALFVASQLHLPVGVGNVHLLLNAIAGILLCRYVGTAIAVALSFQYFLFAHGGLYTLGLNIAVMGLPALCGFGLFALVRRKIIRSPRWAFPIGASIGLFVSSTTVALNATAVWLGLEDGGAAAALTVLLFHIPVVVVETLVTGTLVAYLVRVKPEWLVTPSPA